MSTISISVIIPAFNAQSFIAEALESIASQTTPPLEVIVIDDGSMDATTQTVRKWIEMRRPEFEVQLHRQENAGISSARNAGIKKSQGGWIALLDADDIWEKNHLDRLMQGIALAPAAVAIYGAGRLFNDIELSKSLYDDFWDNPSKKYGNIIENGPYYMIDRSALPRLVKGNFIKPSSLIFRRDILTRIGMFCESLGVAEDREFLVRLLLNGSFVYCSTPITRYRWHDNNASQTKNSKRNLGCGLQAIQKVLSEQENALTKAELVECQNTLLNAGRDYMAVCSRGGIKAYVNGLKFITKLSGRGLIDSHLVVPRHLLNALYFSLKP